MAAAQTFRRILWPLLCVLPIALTGCGGGGGGGTPAPPSPPSPPSPPPAPTRPAAPVVTFPSPAQAAPLNEGNAASFAARSWDNIVGPVELATALFSSILF